MRLLINTSYPRSEINFRLPDVKLRQDFGGFNIAYSGPDIVIDQKQSMLELGFEDVTYMTKKFVAAGRQAVLSGIARASQDGDRLMTGMETGENVFAALARENMFDHIPEINVAASPRTRPKIDMHYDMEINWLESKVDINFEIYPFRVEWILGRVDVRVAVDSKFDVKG